MLTAYHDALPTGHDVSGEHVGIQSDAGAGLAVSYPGAPAGSAGR